MKQSLKVATFLFGVTALMFCVTAVRPSNALALSGSDFRPGRIIDDVIFYNSQSMTTGQIQQFLESKVPNCDYNGTQPASDWGYPNITHAQLAEYKRNGTNGFSKDTGFHAPPYKCLTMYSQSNPQMEAASGYCSAINAGTRTAAQIINDVAKACGINPQVLIILLEKEQSLITDNWPLNRQHRSATGFACPDTALCDPAYEGFFYQVYSAARQFRVYQTYPNSYNYIAGRANRIYWQTNYGNFVNPSGNADDPSRAGQTTCGYSSVYIENQATAALYIYTPYRPNQKSLANLRGTGDDCSTYGNRNFWRLFNDWFGSTQGTVHNGVDYAPVFDATYYLNRYPDLKTALNNNPATAFDHFINFGMNEGRQATDTFNVISYKNRYPDLRMVFRGTTRDYYIHYVTSGKKEGRIATGDVAFMPITTYKNVDYSSVYNFSSYLAKYADLNTTFRNDDAGAIIHFANNGMNEGRQATDTFNVTSYKNRYPDLRTAFGTNLKPYYLHYINNGLKEGRIATGNELNGTTKLGITDYAAVYNFNAYITKYSDLRSVYGTTDDIGALKHFVTLGMNEGRQAIDTFNVQKYQSNYSDLRSAFKNDLKAYYLHYINYGKSEGRTAI